MDYYLTVKDLLESELEEADEADDLCDTCSGDGLDGG